MVCQARLALCCLDGERVVGSDDSSVLERFANWKRTTKIAVSALSLEALALHDETV